MGLSKDKICIPRYNGMENEWVTFDPRVLEHKVYPECQCGLKFVPIHPGDVKCFFCLFPEREKIVTITPKEPATIQVCSKCGTEIHRRRYRPTCVCASCVALALRERARRIYADKKLKNHAIQK